MPFAFELGQATLDVPDDVDKLLQRIRGFRRQTRSDPGSPELIVRRVSAGRLHGQSLDCFNQGWTSRFVPFRK
jgi:hypothetical protein